MTTLPEQPIIIIESMGNKLQVHIIAHARSCLARVDTALYAK